MKKLFALLTALAIAFSLAACGSTPSGSGASTSGSAAPTASGSAAASGSGEAAEPVGDPVTLTLASSYKDTDAEGQYLNYFMDYVTEHSGGTITFTKYMAGTLGSAAEELSLMQNGDVDVIALYAPVYAFELPEFT